MEYKDLIKAKQQNDNSVNTIPPHTNSISTGVYDTSPIDEAVMDKLFRGDAAIAKEYSHFEAEKNKYAKYDVNVNALSTEEELQRERAKNQSALEQGFNMVVQAVANEVVIGGIKGFSDIADLFINMFKNEPNDYTNAVSQELESWQDAIRNKFAIYEKDPDKSFNILDTGWIFNGLVSVASTATMALPTAGVVKGAALLTKIPKLGKALKGARAAAVKGTANALRKVPAWSSISTGRMVNAIERGASITTNAAVSRTIENYMEAREVYKEVYDNKLEEVNSLTKEQREELIANNPQLAGKSNEEIAKYIAGESADKTFKNDYWALAFDILQFHSISSLWKPKAGNRATAALKIENINSMRQAAIDAGAENVKLLATTGLKGWGNRQLYKLKNPLQTIASIPFTEGIEEMMQGYFSEAGKIKAEEIMHPYTFTPLELSSYLSDPESWEQGFWGVVGGKGFEKVSTYAGNAYKMIKAKINKEDISKQDYALGLTADEKIRASEIRNRTNLFKNYKNEMDRLNQSEVKGTRNVRDDKGNIVYEEKTITDNNGKEVKIPVPKEEEYTLNDSEIEEAKVKATNDFLADIVMNSIDAGNYNLLKDYLKSKEVRDSMRKSVPEYSVIFNDTLLEKMDKVKNNYEDNVYSIGNAVEDENNVSFSAITKLSRNVTRSQLVLESIDDRINALNNNIDRLNLSDDEKTKVNKRLLSELYKEYNQIKNYADNIRSRTAKIENEKNNVYQYSEQGRDAELYYIDRSLSSLRELIKNIAGETIDISSFNEVDFDYIISDLIKDTTIDKSNPTTFDFSKLQDGVYEEDNISLDTDTKAFVIPEPITKKIDLLKSKAYLEAYIPKTLQDKRYFIKEMQEQEDMFYGIKIANAAKQIEDWAIKQDDLVQTYKDITTNNVPEELKDALNVLRWGYSGTKEWVNTIIQSLIEEQEKRDRIEEESGKANVSGETLTKDKAEELQKKHNPVEEDRKKDTINTEGNPKDKANDDAGTPPSTGELQQTPNKAPDGSPIQTTDDPNNKTDNTVTDLLRKQAEERKKDSDDAEKLFKREEQAIRVLDNQEEIIFKNAIVKYFKERVITSDDIDDIINLDIKTTELSNKYANKIIDDYKSGKIAIKNIEKVDHELIINAIQDEIMFLRSTIKMAKLNTTDDKRTIINKLLVKSRLASYSKDIFKNVDAISDYLKTDNNELIDKLVQSYIEDIYGDKLSNLKTVHIDDLILYLYNKYCANENIFTKKELKDVFKLIRDQKLLRNYNSNVKGNYNIVFNNSMLDSSAGNYNNFAIAISELEASRRANDSNMRFNPVTRKGSIDDINSTEFENLNKLINSKKLQYGTKLIVELADNGYLEIYAGSKDKKTKLGTLNVPAQEVDSQNNTVTYKPRIGKNAVLIHGVTSTTKQNKDGSKLYNSYRLIADPIFQAIYNDKELFDIVYKYRITNNKSKFDNDLAEQFRTKLFEAIKDKGDINKYFNKANEITGKDILDSISYIAVYDTSPASADDLEYHRLNYYNYCKKEFFNYQKSYEIAKAINDNSSKYTITFNGLTIKTSDNVIKKGVEISDTEININQLKLNGKSNPIVMFENDASGMTRATIEDSRIDLSGKIIPPLSTGSMGLFLGFKNEAMMIATLTTPNKLSKDNGMKSDMTNELVNIISGAIDKRNKGTNAESIITELYDKFSYLFNSRDLHAPSIFSGIFNMSSVDKETGSKYIVFKNDNNDKGFTISFYVDKKDNDKLVIKVKDDRQEEKITYIKDGNEKELQTAIKEIVNGITYNKSFVAKRDNEAYKNNPYFRKTDNGGFIIKLNNNKREYDNFADFVIRENAFKTNAIINDTIESGDSITSMYMEVKETKTKKKKEDTTKKVEKEYNFNKASINEAKTKLTETITKVNGKPRKINEPIKAIDILKAIGLDQNEDISKIINKGETSIIPEEVYYNSTLGEHQAQFESSNNKITLVKYMTNINDYIGKSNHTVDTKKSYIQKEMMRMLVHESIHKKISELTKEQRSYILTQIADVYDETIRQLNKKIKDKTGDTKTYKKTLKWLQDETIFGNIKERNNKINDSILNEAEEFLVESITREDFYSILNELETESGEDYIVENENKSIFNKIIDILFKIFNKLVGKDVDLNTKSILAKEYKILSDDIKVIQDTIKKVETNITPENNRENDGETSKENNEDNVLYELDEELIEDEEYKTENIDLNDLFFSATTDIETYNTKLNTLKISSMNDFIKQFPIENRTDIEQMLDNNEITYYCK